MQVQICVCVFIYLCRKYDEMDVTFTNEPEDKLNDKRCRVRRLFIGLAWRGSWPYQNSIGDKVQFSNIVFVPSAFIVIKQQTWEKFSLHIKKQLIPERPGCFQLIY